MKTFLAMAMAATMAIPAAAQAAPDPLDLVKRKYDEMQGLIKRFPRKEDLHQGIREVMETFVDYRELSRRTLPGEWDKLKKKQQDEFVNEFKKMIQRTYVKRFDPDRQFQIEYRGSKVNDDGTAVVESNIRSGRSEARVDYRFHRRAGDWWAYDVVIDDVSMVQNYRKQFHDILARSGWEGLMDRLRKKNAKAQE